jgi:hypothetical protein
VDGGLAADVGGRRQSFGQQRISVAGGGSWRPMADLEGTGRQRWSGARTAAGDKETFDGVDMEELLKPAPAAAP